MPKVAVLHTSFVFVTVEPVITDLIGELIPEAEILHFVDSDVLATVVREKGISEKSEARMVHLAQAAEAAGADVIFSACSSLGPTPGNRPPARRRSSPAAAAARCSAAHPRDERPSGASDRRPRRRPDRQPGRPRCPGPHDLG